MENAAHLVDLDRYPVLDLDAPAGRTLVEDCRRALAATGACELPGFIRPEALARMAREAAEVAPLGHHHEGKATPYLEVPDETFPHGHPRRSWDAYSLSAVAWDLIPEHHALRALYTWDGLPPFLAACLGEDRLYRYADPLGACNVAVMDEGDCLEWHFDQTDFVVSLALQSSERGGDFLCAPRIRSDRDENYAAVEKVLRGGRDPVVVLPMRPGTLLLFEGRHSLHSVSPVEGARPRLVALLSYDTQPGTCGSELLQKARYGRVLRP